MSCYVNIIGQVQDFGPEDESNCRRRNFYNHLMRSWKTDMFNRSLARKALTHLLHSVLILWQAYAWDGGELSRIHATRAFVQLASRVNSEYTFEGVELDDAAIRVHDLVQRLIEVTDQAIDQLNDIDTPILDASASDEFQDVMMTLWLTHKLERDFAFWALELSHKYQQSVIVLQSGHIGIGHRSCTNGDVVALIAGLDVPMVLRLVNGQRYRIIGRAYLDDAMDGELWPEDENQLQMVDIV
jgi:hypothetical protein